MSENTNLNPQPEEPTENVVVDPDASEPTPTTAAEQAPADESTIGTGTSMALGCIAGTVVLIVFGLLFLFLSTLI